MEKHLKSSILLFTLLPAIAMAMPTEKKGRQVCASWLRIAGRGAHQYFDHPSFSRRNAKKILLGPLKESADIALWNVETGYFTHEQETTWFLRYNFLRKEAYRLAGGRSKASAIELELRTAQILSIENLIAEKYIRMVYRIAELFADRNPVPKIQVRDLFIEGQYQLLNAIEKFDVSRGIRFSTYLGRAAWNEMRGMAIITERIDRREKKMALAELATTPMEDDPGDYERKHALLQKLLPLLPEVLGEREEDVIRRYYGLDCAVEQRETIALTWKVSKARISQIHLEALAKLREAIQGYED